VAAPAFVGHTRAESPLALVIGADVLHLLAGSTWLGGLLALAITLRSLADEGGRAAEVLSRFSTLAAGILAALLVTGSFLAWRILGSLSALVDIAYGRLLLVKIAAVVLVICLAAWNRFRLLPRLRDSGGAGEGAAAMLRRTTLAEAGVLVAVLFVTGFLVDRSPEAEVAAVERERESVQTADLGDITVRVTMTPLLPGTNVVALEMSDAAGEPVEGLEAPVVRISSGDLDFGELELTNQGPGVYEGRGLLPEPGTWDVQVSLKVDEFTVPVDTVEFVVDVG
jgi:copper transport protein